MFVDYETVDRWFEVDYKLGSHSRFGVFDKRILLSWGQVAHGCQQELNFEDLTRIVERSWIPMLSNDIYPEGNGFPLYVPSRIDMLLALEREGYSAEELQIIATDEEWWIDNFLTVDDLAYIDDDLETAVRFSEEFLQALETGRSYDTSGKVLDRSKDRSVCERDLRMFKKFQKEGIPERYQQRVAKIAYRVRAHNEYTRVWLMEMDRAKIRSHYSPFIVCCGGEHSFNDGITFTPKGIDWERTIPSALAHAISESPTIRVPGFLLRGDKVVTTKTLTPSEYAQFWKQHDLDQYLFTWSEVQGEKRCLNCLTKLPLDTSNGRKKFCGEKCRNASKQKRYRERNPEAVQATQRRYWAQFDEQF